LNRTKLSQSLRDWKVSNGFVEPFEETVKRLQDQIVKPPPEVLRKFHGVKFWWGDEPGGLIKVLQDQRPYTPKIFSNFKNDWKKKEEKKTSKEDCIFHEVQILKM